MFFLALLCNIMFVFGQSNDQNYILTRTMLNDASSAYNDKIDYYDGLGRPVQTVMKKATSGLKDIATLQEYDMAGRPSNSFIPTPATTVTGVYVAPSALKTASNSFYGDTCAFGKLVYENSPLGRVTDEFGPGTAWHSNGKSFVTSYHTNSAIVELSCAKYVVASVSSLQRKGLYPAGELFVNKTKDEDEQVSYIFTDKLGKTVLERVLSGSVTNDTYYVYDDFGNLRYVLPPAAADALTATATWADDNQALKDFAYVYKYDGRNRCIQKRLPGCDPFEIRYDKADRLVFSQDGNQKSKGEWTFYLHDVFGRLTVTGLWISTTVPDVTNTVVKSTYDSTGTKLGGYTVNLTLPSTVKLVTVNYYDDYAFTYFAYTFTGKVKQRQQVHSAPNATTQTETYIYDYGTPATNPAERLQAVGYKLNGNAQVTLSQYTYDDVGRAR